MEQRPGPPQKAAPTESKNGSNQMRNDLGGGARGAKARDNPVAANARNVCVFAIIGIEAEIDVRTKILQFTAAR